MSEENEWKSNQKSGWIFENHLKNPIFQFFKTFEFFEKKKKMSNF